MAIFLLILLLLSEAASELIEVKVQTGKDATLPCQAADSFINTVEWRRADPKPDVLLFYKDTKIEEQNPSFKDRVELVDRDLKNGDASLILKNVNINDTGIYECRVNPAGSGRKERAIIKSDPIRTIRLQFPEPAGSEDGNSSPVGLYVGLATAGLVLVAAAVVVAMMAKRGKPVEVVKATVGNTATLHCRVGNSASDNVEWSRDDLNPLYIVLSRQKRRRNSNQNPSFTDRVELDERGGNVSLILKKVNRDDAGRYSCRVSQLGRLVNEKPIKIIDLQVIEPGPDSGNSMNDVPEDENSSFVG